MISEARHTGMVGLSTKDVPRYVTGYAAMILSCHFILTAETFPVFLASSFLLLICTTDTHLSQIPNAATFTLILVALTYQVSSLGAPGLQTFFLGFATGFALLIVPYLMGGMGAGDVKALAALGALLGPGTIFQVFLYTGLVGGLMAIAHYAFNHDLKTKCARGFNALRMFAYTRDPGDLTPEPSKEKLRFPYAAAIAFGFFAYVTWGALI
jgi:prepilin peptidase CpaA